MSANKYKWIVWVNSELDRIISSNDIPEVGKTVYISSDDPDVDDSAIIETVTQLDEKKFDVDAKRQTVQSQISGNLATPRTLPT